MNLQQLITFSTVLSEGSMTAAAEKLYLTQPAVSQQIRNLEEELGVPLLERGVRNARPTPQGQVLYDYAKRIISLTQQAQVAIQTIGEEVRGSLRIGTLNSLGLQMISPAVGSFLRHNSKLHIQLTYGDGPQILADLKAGQLDVAILPDAELEYGVQISDLSGQLLLKDELWAVASGREWISGGPLTLGQLAERPFVRLNEKYTAFERGLAESLNRAKAQLRPVFESNNVGTLKRVIESGIGWGFLPSHAIRKQVRMGRLVVIDLPEIKHSVGVFFYRRKNVPDNPAVEVFFKALRGHILNS